MSDTRRIMKEMGIVGNHFEKMMTEITIKALTPFPILITGETGTGKELVAKLIHRLSNRAEKPIHFINIPAINNGVFESELFGHKKGSFTNASEHRKGILRECDGGTVVLDEISNMPMDDQVKLLRWLESGEIKPVGADKTEKVDVRVIASTNQNLTTLIEKGVFRSDLYYRLNGLSINLSPLRDNIEAIFDLAKFFIDKNYRYFSEFTDYPTGSEISKLFNMLFEAKFKCANFLSGNARELESMIREWLFHRASNKSVSVDFFVVAEDKKNHCPEKCPKEEHSGNNQSNTQDKGRRDLIQNMREKYQGIIIASEKEALQFAFNHLRGNIDDISAALGISHDKLLKKLDLYKIKSVSPNFSPDENFEINSLDKVIYDATNEFIEFLLSENFSKKEISEILEINYNTLYARIRRHNLGVQ